MVLEETLNDQCLDDFIDIGASLRFAHNLKNARPVLTQFREALAREDFDFLQEQLSHFFMSLAACACMPANDITFLFNEDFDEAVRIVGWHDSWPQLSSIALDAGCSADSYNALGLCLFPEQFENVGHSRPLFDILPS